MHVIYSDLMVSPAQGTSPSAAKPRPVVEAWMALDPEVRILPPKPVTIDDFARAHEPGAGVTQRIGGAVNIVLYEDAGHGFDEPAPRRLTTGSNRYAARDALALATRGGAEVLGRADIGHLAPGMCADLALFDLRTLAFAGGVVHDPVGALLLCASPQAAWTVVNGRVVVREGRLATLELEPLVERHNRLAIQLASG